MYKNIHEPKIKVPRIAAHYTAARSTVSPMKASEDRRWPSAGIILRPSVYIGYAHF